MNSFKAIRQISFQPAQQGILVIAGAKGVSVRVTLKVESEDYSHAQMVLDALTGVCGDVDCIQALASPAIDPNQEPNGTPEG